MSKENNLKQIINSRGLKAKWLSEQLGVHETEPSQWVAGRRRPRNDQIKQLNNQIDQLRKSGVI